jgi:hypothetical protein
LDDNGGGTVLVTASMSPVGVPGTSTTVEDPSDCEVTGNTGAVALARDASLDGGAGGLWLAVHVTTAANAPAVRVFALDVDGVPIGGPVDVAAGAANAGIPLVGNGAAAIGTDVVLAVSSSTTAALHTMTASPLADASTALNVSTKFRARNRAAVVANGFVLSEARSLAPTSLRLVSKDADGAALGSVRVNVKAQPQAPVLAARTLVDDTVEIGAFFLDDDTLNAGSEPQLYFARITGL